MVAQGLSGVILDLDNTLIDRQGAMRRWLELLIEPLELSKDQADRLIEAALEQDALGYSARLPFCEVVASALKPYGLSLSGDALWRRLRAELGACVEPISGLDTTLNMLGQRYTLAILSNGSSDNQRLKLKHSGVLECFDPTLIVISSEIGLEKPEPRAFDHMSALLNISHERLLFVGDHPQADIQGAQQVGMKTAWMSMGRAWPVDGAKPDYILSTIIELASCI